MNQPDQDKSSFEEEWRRALEGAALGPSDRVWAGLDHQLADKVRQRRRRWLAYMGVAASLLICLTWGVVWHQARPESRLAAGPTQPPTGSEEGQRSARRPESAANRKNFANAPVESVQSDSGRQAVFQGKPLASRSRATNPRPAPNATAGPTPLAAGKKQVNIPTDDQQLRFDQKRSVPTSKRDRLSRNRPASPAVGQPPNLDKLLAAHGKPDRPLNAAGRGSGQPPSKRVGARQSDAPAGGNRQISAVLTSVAVVRPLLPVGVATEAFTVSDRRLRDQPTVEPAFVSVPENGSETQKSSLWVSTLFSTAHFDPNVKAFYPQYNSVPEIANALPNSYAFNYDDSRSVNKIREGEKLSQTGLSYTVGLHAGADLSKRWTLEGGIEYAYSSSRLRTAVYDKNTITNVKYPLITDLLSGRENATLQASASVRSDAADIENYVFAKSPVISRNATPNTVTFYSDYQYLVLPLRLGYQINRHRKFRFLGLGGLSADLFLRNTHGSAETSGSTTNAFPLSPSISPAPVGAAQQNSSVVITAGKNSAYHSLSVSALLGLGIHYHYSRHFSLMLEPTYRTALYSTTKATSNVRTLPSNLGIGTGLKYYF